MGKRTVMDVFVETQTKGLAAVAVQRHYSYLIGHTAFRGEDAFDVYARNLSEVEPSVLFLLDKPGLEAGWRHGRMLAEAGIVGINIVASHQGRGPDSGIRISEGYSFVAGKFLSVECHMAVDYPCYNYAPCLKALKEIGDPVVAQWLNGQWPDLVRSDAPESFRGRVTGFIESLLKRGRSWIITTHFELCVLAHSLYVADCNLGSIPEDYVPPKGGGILIVSTGEGGMQAFDYDPDYNVIHG